MKDPIDTPVIEKGIPLPPKRKEKTLEFIDNLKGMKIEESFLVKKENKSTATRAMIDLFGEHSWAVRTVDLEYVRVWRLR